MSETKREKAQATARKAAATARRRRDPLVRTEDEKRVTRLWLTGATVDEIAETTELSRATVMRIRKRILEAAMKDRDVLATQLRERELLTIDRLQRAHWAEALKGSVGSSKIVLSCVDRRAKLLGLDAPVKIDATVKSELDAQIERLVEELEAEGLVKGQGA